MKKNNGVFYVAISLVAVFALVSSAVAYSVANNVNVSGDYNYYESEGQPQEAPTFGAVVEDNRADEVVYLDFSAGATTTPGGLFRITNGRTPKICTIAQIDITSATSLGGIDGDGAPLEFSVATSSSATALSGNVGIIASTTLATSSTALLDSVRYPGTYVDKDQDIGGASFELGAGVSLLGQFDAYVDTTDRTSATSSSVYSGVAGKAYIDCKFK